MVDQEFITNLRGMLKRMGQERWTGASLHVTPTGVGSMVFTEHIHMPKGHEPEFLSVSISTPVLTRVAAWRERDTSIGLVAAVVITSFGFGPIQSLVNLLKAGDELEAYWFLGNNTQALTDAGMVHDEVDVRIVRNGKNYAQLHWSDITTPSSGWVVGFDSSHSFEVKA